MIAVFCLLFEFVILTLFKITGTTDVGNFIASIMILLHVFAMISSFNQNRKLKDYSMALTLGLFMRLAFLLIDLFAYPRIVLPNGHADEEMFYGNAVWRAEAGISGRGYYPVVMGTLFRYIGYNRFYGQYVSMLCSMVALVFLAYSFSELDLSYAVKQKVFKIVCLLPNFAILSSLFIREAMITMFLTISFFLLIRWVVGKTEKFFWLALLAVLPAAALHSGTIAVWVGYIAIRLIYDNKGEKISFSVGNILVTVVVAFVAVTIIDRSGDTFLGKFNSVDSIEDIANMTDLGARTSYLRYVGNSNNPVNFIIFTPLRLFFFLFSPLPWMWGNIGDIIAFFFSSLYYLIIIWNTIRFLWRGKTGNKPLVIALFIVALVTTFVFAWGTSNAGTAARHRDKLVTLFALIWALSSDGLQKSLKENSKYRKRNIRI